MANLRSKNDRAVAAYIKSILPSQYASVPIYVSHDSRDRTQAAGLIDVITSQGPEEPMFTGNHILNVKIRVQSPALNQPGGTNPDKTRVDFDALVDVVFDAFHITDNGCDYAKTASLISTAGRALKTTGTVQAKANNADMDAYTCQYVQGITYAGAPDEGSGALAFVEVLVCQMRACAANVD